MYTAKDASMAHLAITQRMQPTNTSVLFAEYFAICQLYSDTLVARETHRQYITQVDHLRMLLLTQKRQKMPSNAYAGKQSGAGAPMSSVAPSSSRPSRRAGEASASSTTLEAAMATSGGSASGGTGRQSPSEPSTPSPPASISGASGGRSVDGAGKSTGLSSRGFEQVGGTTTATITTSSSSDTKRKGTSISTSLANATPPASIAPSTTSANNTSVQRSHASTLSKDAGASSTHNMAASAAAASSSAHKEAKRRRSTATATSGGASKAANVSSLSIIRNDCWGSEYYMETCYKPWNAFINRLSDELMEPVLTWVTDNDSHPCSRSIIRFTNQSAYDTAHGMCFLRWSTWSEVKNYVDALHAVVNAPLSAFYTPLAIGLEVLGVPVLCVSLAPVSGPWNDWDQITPVWHAFCAMCATLRLMKPLKHVEGGRSDDVRLNVGGLAQALGLTVHGMGSGGTGTGHGTELFGARGSGGGGGLGGGNGAGVPTASDDISALVAAMRGMSGVNVSDNLSFALRNSVLSMGFNDTTNNYNNTNRSPWDASASTAGGYHNNTATSTVSGWSTASPGSPQMTETGVPTYASKRSVFYAGVESYSGVGSMPGAQGGGGGNGGGGGGHPFFAQQNPQQVRSHAMQNSAVREDVGKVSPFVAAAGADARWYFIDARALTLYQVLSRRSFVAGRMPRREMFSSLNGCVLRDCGPNELVLQTKLRTIVSQLLNGFAVNESILLSTLCHKHGVRYGPYVYTILDLLKAEERQLTQSLQLALRQGSSSPNVQARVQQCVRCIQAVLGELLARAVKHLIRHRWLTTTRGNVGWLARLQACATAKAQISQRAATAATRGGSGHTQSSPMVPGSSSLASPTRTVSTTTTTTATSGTAMSGAAQNGGGSMDNSGLRVDSASENSQGRITVVPDIDGSLLTSEQDAGTHSGSFPPPSSLTSQATQPQQEPRRPLPFGDLRARQSDSRSEDTGSQELPTTLTPPHRDSTTTAAPSNEGSSRGDSSSAFLSAMAEANSDEAQLLMAAEAAQLQRDMQDLEQPFMDAMLHVLEGVFQVVAPETTSPGTAGNGTGGSGTPLQPTDSPPAANNNNNGSTSNNTVASGGGAGAAAGSGGSTAKSWAYPPFNTALNNVQFRADVFEELLFLVNDLYIFRMYVADERTNEWQLVRRRAPVIMRRGGGSRSRSANQRRRDGGEGSGAGGGGGNGGKGSGSGGGASSGGSRFLSSEEERITARPGELNAGWALQCLQELFGMPLIIRDGKIDILRDAQGHIASQSSKLFEQILAPGGGGWSRGGPSGRQAEAGRGSPSPYGRSPASSLFSAPYANTLDIPLALRLPSREKALEYAQEQRQIGLRICALSAQMTASSMGLERALHYARMGRYVQLHAADIRIACRGWPLSEDFDFLRRAAWASGETGEEGSRPTAANERARSAGPLRRGSGTALRSVVVDRHTTTGGVVGGGVGGVVNTSAEDMRIQTAFQADMHYRLCLLNSKSDLREALRAWWSYGERAESLIKSSTAYGQVVRTKIFLLLNIAATFAGPAVSRALEIAISDLDVLTGGLANIHAHLGGMALLNSNSLLGSADSMYGRAGEGVGGGLEPALTLTLASPPPSGTRGAAGANAARFTSAIATTSGKDSGSRAGASGSGLPLPPLPPPPSASAALAGANNSSTGLSGGGGGFGTSRPANTPPPPLMTPARVATGTFPSRPAQTATPHQLSSVLSINSATSAPTSSYAQRLGQNATGGSGGGAITSVGLVVPGSPFLSSAQGPHSSANGGGGLIGASASGGTGGAGGGVGRAFDLRAVQCAELYFLLLTSLVKHTLVPDANMTPKESISRAMTFCALRRELIVVCYGETSLEAAAAANDLGMLFMRDPATHVAANEEFLRARYVLVRHLNYLRRLAATARRLSVPGRAAVAAAAAAAATSEWEAGAITGPLGDLAGSGISRAPPSTSAGSPYLAVPGAVPSASAGRRAGHATSSPLSAYGASTSAVEAPATAARYRHLARVLGPSIMRDTPIATSLFPQDSDRYAGVSSMDAMVRTTAGRDGLTRRDASQQTARSELAETMLHVEKALHSVQNNIAFLYCYEAREQYYSSQLLFLEYVEEARRRGVITRPAIGEQLYAKRCQKKDVVEALLNKAESMLCDVLEKETEVPVFDYAVALNNMACVQLYRNHLIEARALVTKSLAITARLCSMTATVPPTQHRLNVEAAMTLTAASSDYRSNLAMSTSGTGGGGGGGGVSLMSEKNMAGTVTGAMARLKAQAVAASLSPPLPRSLHPGLVSPTVARPASAMVGGGESAFPSSSSNGTTMTSSGTAAAGGAGGSASARTAAAAAAAAAGSASATSLSAETVKSKLQALAMGYMEDVTAEVDQENIEAEGELGAAILQCRATSLSILAQIDAQKQFIDRLRIQRLCAAHLAAWQSRRRQRRADAAQELRRIGLGALTRVYLAKRYRFSGHHFWMRQPAVYGPKLVTMHYDVATLTSTQLHDVWGGTVEKATSLLQRVLRGTRDRQRLGEQYQFCHYYLTRVRPAVEASIWGRMAQVYEVCMLHWLVGYGLLYLKEMKESVQSGTIWYITARDHFLQRARSDRLVIQLSELAGREKIFRDAIKSQEKRVRMALKHECRAHVHIIAVAEGMTTLPSNGPDMSYGATTVGGSDAVSGTDYSLGSGGLTARLKDGELIRVSDSPVAAPVVPTALDTAIATSVALSQAVGVADDAAHAHIMPSPPPPAHEVASILTTGTPTPAPPPAPAHGAKDVDLVASVNADTEVPLRHETTPAALVTFPTVSADDEGGTGVHLVRPSAVTDANGDPAREEASSSPTTTTTTTNHGTVRYRHGREVGEGRLLREALRDALSAGDDSDPAGPSSTTTGSGAHAPSGVGSDGVPLHSPLGTPVEWLAAQSADPSATTDASTSSASSKGRIAAVTAEAYKDRLRAAQVKQAAAAAAAATSTGSAPSNASTSASTAAMAAAAALNTSQCSLGSNSQPLSSTRRRDRVVSLQLENNQVRVPGAVITSSSSPDVVMSNPSTSPASTGSHTSPPSGTASHTATHDDDCITASGPHPQGERKLHVDEMERKHREEERQRLLAYREKLAEGGSGDDDTISASSGGRRVVVPDSEATAATTHTNASASFPIQTNSSSHSRSGPPGSGGSGEDQEMAERVAAAAQMLQDFYFVSRALPLFAEAALYQHTLYGYFLWPITVAPICQAHEALKQHHLQSLETSARDAILLESGIEAACVEMLRVHSSKGYAQLQQYRLWGEQTSLQLHQYNDQLQEYYKALAAAQAPKPTRSAHQDAEADKERDHAPQQQQQQQAVPGRRAVDPTRTTSVAAAAQQQNNSNNNTNNNNVISATADVVTAAATTTTTAAAPASHHVQLDQPRAAAPDTVMVDAGKHTSPSSPPHARGDQVADTDAVEMKAVAKARTHAHAHRRHDDGERDREGNVSAMSDKDKDKAALILAAANSVPRPDLLASADRRWVESLVPTIHRAAPAHAVDDYSGEFTPSSTTTEGTLDDHELTRRIAAANRDARKSRYDETSSVDGSEAPVKEAHRSDRASRTNDTDGGELARRAHRSHRSPAQENEAENDHRSSSDRKKQRGGSGGGGGGGEGEGEGEARKGRSQSKKARPSTAEARPSSAAPAAASSEQQRGVDRHARPSSAAGRAQLEEELRTVQSDALRQALARFAR